MLIPDLVENFTTAGKVDIHIKTSDKIDQGEPTKISLHSHQIKILEEAVTVTNANDPSIPINIVGHEYDLDRVFYIIHLRQVILSYIF